MKLVDGKTYEAKILLEHNHGTRGSCFVSWLTDANVEKRQVEIFQGGHKWKVDFVAKRLWVDGLEIKCEVDEIIKPVNNQIKDELVEPINVVCHLPTDMTVIGDKDVDAAVKFIRQHSNTSLRVVDVVSEANVSRRTLEGRFRKFLNRSIAEEIRRVRVELIARLLIDTNLSVSKIAAILNYDKGHMARYFAKEKGLSPLAYRNKISKESD